MKKKLLLFIMLVLLIPAIARAYDIEVDGIYYLIDGSNATVTFGDNFYDISFNSYSGSVIIPSTITYGGTTFSVTSIGSSAFAECDSMSSITIPNSVTFIATDAFRGCDGLTSVYIPNSVTSIGNNAFHSCSNLTNVIIGSSVTTIGAGAFHKCSSLRSITIPNSVTSIGIGAFSGCSSLTAINIPNSVKSIGGGAFGGTPWYDNQPDGLVYAGLVAYRYKGIMPSGTNITIKEGTLAIVASAFEGCNGLTSITIPNSVSSIGDAAFIHCNSLTSITIPNSVTSIGESAFYFCRNLNNITIPHSVKSIGGDAFEGTPWYDNQPDGLIYAGLVAYHYKGIPVGTITIEDGTLAIAGYAFAGCSRLTSIIIPNTVTSIGARAFGDCNQLTDVYIPNSVTSIGDYAFQDCSNMTDVIIGNSVTTIGERAFAYCTNLSSIILGNSVTSIGEYAFMGCSSLTNIDIPNSVIYIANMAFEDCTSLASVTIGDSLMIIGPGAFYNCSSLSSIVIPNSVVSIRENAFIDCRNLASVTIGNSVTVIGEGAFSDCSGLTNLPIPNSVVSIGIGAFTGCSGLTNLSIPNSVVSIGIGAFSGCSGLTNLTIPNSVISIGNSAFHGCNLSSINVDNGNPKYDSRDNCNAIIETLSNTLIVGCLNTVIPNTVIAIHDGAFGFCSGLCSITIPNSVTSIGSAFIGCPDLTEIYSLALTPPIIGPYTFYGFYGSTLYVPKEAVNAYKEADYWKNFSLIVAIGSLMPLNTFVVDGIYYRVTDYNECCVIANEDVENYYAGDLVIPESVTYEDQTFVVTGIENNAFDGCYELSSVVIPNSVETIGEQAFQGCTGMKSVTIGYDVSAIGAKAFNYCNALEKVTCLGVVPPVMASIDCFSNAAYNHSKLIVPRNSQESYLSVNYWYKFANIDGWGSAGPGDIDSDGFVSISDVTALIDALLSGDLESIYFDSADLNGNGRLDIGDVTSLIDNLLNSK